MLRRTLLFISTALLPLGPARAEDWPQFRGPDRTGVSKEKGLLPAWPPGGPKQLWIFREAGAGFSSMSIVGDRLYSMGAADNKEYVYAIDLKTRTKLWSTEVGDRYVSHEGDGPRGTPTVDGNFLYTIGGHGDLVCVETIGGRKVWSQGLKTGLGGQAPNHGYAESPLVDGNQVVATPGGEKGAIAAFDKKTGVLKWRSRALCSAWYTSMIVVEVGGVRQYIQAPHPQKRFDWDRGLVGVRASDGELLWEMPRHFGACTPICRNNCIYQACADHCLLLKLAFEGGRCKAEEVYTNKTMQNYYSGVVLVGDHIYGYSEKSGWTCQNFKTGKKIWSKNPRLGIGSLIYADGCLYGYHEHRGDILLLKATPDGYKEQGKFRIPEETKLPRGNGRIYTYPVVANGKLYLRDNDLIFCYDIRRPQS